STGRPRAGALRVRDPVFEVRVAKRGPSPSRFGTTPMADAPGNSPDAFDADSAFLVDDNLSISVDGLYAILDEQPLPPPDDQCQAKFPFPPL
ncbi:hypothetical protein BHM03_00050507, partial [Ensete ventricosum]